MNGHCTLEAIQCPGCFRGRTDRLSRRTPQGKVTLGFIALAGLALGTSAEEPVTGSDTGAPAIPSFKYDGPRGNSICRSQLTACLGGRRFLVTAEETRN